MPPRFHQVVETAAYVDDLDLAEAFYRDVLGLELHSKEKGRHVFFRISESSMFLLFNPATTVKDGQLPRHGATGAGHFAFGIAAEDLEAWDSHLRTQGIAIEREITWPRGGRSIYFRDPGGNLVEIITPGVWGLPSGW